MVRCLALLASPVDTYVPWHSIVGLMICVLLRVNTILLRYVSLIGRATHVVTYKVGSVVYQFLLPLRLYAVVVRTLCSLVRVRLIRFVR